jgi:hypothetical protein
MENKNQIYSFLQNKTQQIHLFFQNFAKIEPNFSNFK